MDPSPLQLSRIAPFAVALVASAVVASPNRDASLTFTETVDVRLVNVEVVVEDRKSRDRVLGLSADDFRLFVDGVEVEVAQFAEIRGGQPVAAAGPKPPPPSLTAGEPVGNSYVIYIDDYFAIGAQRNLALDRLLRQLDRLRPADQMAIVAFGGRDLELLSGWTRDRDRLRAALEAAKRRPAFGLMRFTERLRQGIAVIPGSTSSFYSGEVHAELAREAAALQATMQGLADAPGRKILVALAGGWPAIETAIIGRRGAADDPPLRPAENDLDLLAPMVETANLLGFTLYPIDLPGVRTETRVARVSEFDIGWRATAGQRNERGGLTIAPSFPEGGRTSSGFVYGQPYDDLFGQRQPFSDTLHGESLRQSSLRVIARDTGGRPLLGASRGRALAEVVDDTGSYYWLAFTPRREYDDDLHRIRVEVRGDYRVRTRRNFRDLSAAAQASIATIGAALVGDAEAVNEIGLVVGQPARAGYRKVTLPIRIHIPTDRIVFLPAGGVWVAELQLRLAAVAAADRHSEMPIIPVRLALETLPPAGSTLPFDTEVTLHRATRKLVVSLFDPLGDEVLLATAELPR